VLLKYAEAQLNIRPLKQNNIQQAVAAYRNVLRVDKQNSDAALRLTGIYISLNMAGEAELIAGRQLAGKSAGQTDPTKEKQNPELTRMLAVAMAKQRKFDQAAETLKRLIQEQPEYVLAYETLGQLIEQRSEDFPGKPADWFDLAVSKNPSSALAYIVRAAFRLRSNDPNALNDLEQAEKLDISDTSIRLRLARALVMANEVDKAESHLIALRNAEPANLDLWKTWAQLALKSSSQTRMNETAETALKKLTYLRLDFMPLAAQLFIQAQNYGRAEYCINLLQQEKMFPALTAAMEALVARGRGQDYKAVESWLRAINLGNKSPQIRLNLASTLNRLGNTQSALGYLRTLVSDSPNLFGGRLALAKLLAQIGNWAEAAAQAQIACQLDNRRADAMALLCQAKIKLFEENSTSKDSSDWNKLEQQVDALQKATGDAIEPKLLKFQILMHKDNLAEAEKLINQLINSHPQQTKLFLAKADLLIARHELEQAMTVVNATITQFPLASEPVRYLATLLATQGDYDKAGQLVEQALQRIEQPIVQRQLCLLLAQIYTLSKDREKAYADLDKFAKKLPNDILIKRELLKYRQVINDPNRAQQLVDDIKSLEGPQGWQWRYEQAKLWYEKNLQARYSQITSLLKENLLADPYNQANRMLLALVYERAGQSQLAVSTYCQALDRSPRDIRIIVPTVAALQKVGEYDRADEILRRAAGEKLVSPQLQNLQWQSHLRHGELDSAGNILENLLRNDPNNRAVCLSLALLKMQQRQFEQAQRLLAGLRTNEPNSLQVAAVQVELNVRRNKPAEALALCDELVKNNNNASAYILRARTHAKFANNDKAQQDLDRAAAIEPNNVAVWVARSNFYRTIGRPDKAIEQIQHALSIAPNNIQIQKRAIQAFLNSANRQKLQQAKGILTQALESYPDDIQLRFLKARSQIADGTAPAIKEATQILRRITEDQPKSLNAWLLLGEIMLKQQKPAQAMDAAMRGLVQKSDDKNLMLLKARAEAARSPALAIPTRERLYKLDPNDAGLLILLAETYMAADTPKKALDLLNKHSAEFTNTADVRRIRIATATALYKNNNKDQAKQEFERLYQAAPDDPTALLAHTGVLKDDKLWSQITEIVENWCRKNPKDANTPTAVAVQLAAVQSSGSRKIAESILREVLDSHHNCLLATNALALLLQMTGRPIEAVPLYKQIVTAQPDNVVAVNNLAWILCQEQNKPKEAIEMTQQALKIAPNYVDLIDTQGVIYLRLGDFDKAIQDFTKCLQLYPETAPASVASRFHLGKAYASRGQKDKAADNLKKALEQNSKIGGLSPADVDEAQHLINALLEGT